MAKLIAPQMHSGGLLALYRAMWEPYYEAGLSLLGSTGTIMSIGDPASGQPNATTFVPRGEEQATFTWSEALASFDVPLDLTSPDSFQGIVPVIKFNGTDEQTDTPSVSYWDGGDGTTDQKLSFGVWVNLDATATEDLLVRDSGAGTGSWRLGTRRLLIRDQSTMAICRRDRDSNPSLGVWHFLAATYDGQGGGSAANGIKMYDDGVVVASTATNDGGYVAMEADGAKVTLANSPPSVQFFNGKMAGGPLGLFFTKTELSADAVRRLYQLGRAALGV